MRRLTSIRRDPRLITMIGTVVVGAAVFTNSALSNRPPAVPAAPSQGPAPSSTASAAANAQGPFERLRFGRPISPAQLHTLAGRDAESAAYHRRYLARGHLIRLLESQAKPRKLWLAAYRTKDGGITTVTPGALTAIIPNDDEIPLPTEVPEFVIESSGTRTALFAIVPPRFVEYRLHYSGSTTTNWRRIRAGGFASDLAAEDLVEVQLKDRRGEIFTETRD